MADQLLGVLQTIRANFSAGLFCWGIIKDPNTQEMITKNEVFILEDRIVAIRPGNNRKILENKHLYDVTITGPGIPPDFEHISREFSKMLLRNFTLDCFEAVRDYSRTSGQLHLMRSQPWYHFARLARNALTHDQCWNFKSYDLPLLPVTWKGKTIEASLQGQEIQGTVYSWYDACVLYSAMFEFGKTLK